MPKTAYFSKALFQFLVELKYNNDRTWFNANKSRYENDLKKPLLAFAENFQSSLSKVNKAFISDKRSVFRIYRDTRFAKDKTPYKTHAALHFEHHAFRDVHTPGFYLHIEPGESFAAAGTWGPDPDSLKRIRVAISKSPAWPKLSKMPLYDADSLKRAPKGFAPEHPRIKDIRRRHFIAWLDLKDSDILSPNLPKTLVAAYKKFNPLVHFLCDALQIKG